MFGISPVFIAALVLAGCAGTSAAPSAGGAASGRVAGTVTYLQRVSMPPSAVIKVQLVDVSRADAPATMHSRFTLALAVAATIGLAGCGQDSAPRRVAAPAPAQTADTIFTGGDIVTVDDAQPSAEAVTVKGGKILARLYAGQVTLRAGAWR